MLLIISVKSSSVIHCFPQPKLVFAYTPLMQPDLLRMRPEGSSCTFLFKLVVSLAKVNLIFFSELISNLV